MSDPLIGQLRQDAASLLRFGVVVRDETGGFALSADGLVQAARWTQGFVPRLGDAVAFLVTAAVEGQSSILVLGKVGGSPSAPEALPDEARVTSVPASSPTITVTAGGTPMTAKFVGVAPAVGDTVLLDHRPGGVYAVGRVAATPTPQSPAPAPAPASPAPPPAPPVVGQETFSAIDSSTAVAGGAWSSQIHGVRQGQGAGTPSYAGSWFYGTGPTSLSGRSVTSAAIYLPPRLRVGAYESAATVHLYAHGASTRPAADPARVWGPHDVTLPSGWGGGWVELPPIAAEIVIDGGGLAIAGNPYLGFAGRVFSPQSGAIRIAWRA